MYTDVVFVNDNSMINCKYMHCDRSRFCTSYIPIKNSSVVRSLCDVICLICVLGKYAILAHSGYKYVVMVIPANSFVHDRFGTYCIGDNQMLRRACASTQSPCATFTARAHKWHVIIHLADS